MRHTRHAQPAPGRHVPRSLRGKADRQSAGNIGELLLRCRTDLRLRLKDVDAATGVSYATISQLERGMQANVRRDTRERLESFLRKNGYFLAPPPRTAKVA